MDTIMDQFIEKIRKLMPKWVGELSTRIYILSMLVFFPLFFTDGMFNLCYDKRNFFLFCSIIYACIMFPPALAALYDWGNDMHAPKTADTIFFLILTLAFVSSTIFALDTNSSFFEMNSRTVSGLCFLFCLVTFLIIRQYGKTDKFLLWTWIAGSSILYLFGILCACGINVMNIQYGLEPKDIPVYLTPLSNTNFNTCYVCLMLPPIMGLYILCKEQLSQILCRINLYLGFLFTLFIKTESSIIAIIFGVILLGYFALEADLWFTRYLHIIGIYLGAKLTILILLTLFPNNLHSFEGLGLLLLDYKIVICELLCYALLFFIWSRKYNIRKIIAPARKILLLLSILLACGSAVCVVFANINAASLPEGSFLQNLVITDSTFNRRGYIWIRTVSALKEESIGRLLIGNGMNSFRILMYLTHSLPPDSTFADPHNEFLQMATDMGILGLIGYFGLLLSSLVKGIKNWKKDKFHIVIIITLSVYMIQALANEYSIYTLPLLFIFLGLINRKKTVK